jgi:hypothetical protein
MLSLYRDPHFTFRFAEDRLIPRFHLEGVEPGRSVDLFNWNAITNERLEKIATALVGPGSWVNLNTPLIVRAGSGFIVVVQCGGQL